LYTSKAREKYKMCKNDKEKWVALIEDAEGRILKTKDQERKKEKKDMELSLSAFRRMLQEGEPFPGDRSPTH